MIILGLLMFSLGYAIIYYAANVLVGAYLRTGTMNPAPFTVLLGIPQGGAGNASAGSQPSQ